MTTELRYLVFVSVLTALLWVAYILNLIIVRGPKDAVGYPENPKPIAPWASRLKAAHYNAVENLVVFAALVLVAHAAGVSRESTQVCAIVYFWSRVVHPLGRFRPKIRSAAGSARPSLRCAHCRPDQCRGA